jgi:cyclopropane fatty-acyl-phospholipid synthase-like methyltransferase
MTQLEKRLVNREGHSRTNIKIMERIFEQLNLAGIQQVLEVGCGIGMVSAHLAEKYGMQVTGTDYDPEQVALVKKKFTETENLQFRVADAVNLPFGD